MEATRSNLIAMPACYAVVTEEEMVYLEGGAFSITKEDVIRFGVTFTHNLAMVVGSLSLTMGVDAVTKSISNMGFSLGMQSIFNTIAGFNGWQMAALVGCTACAAYYVTLQVMQIVALVKAIGQSIQETVQQVQQNQAQAQGQAVAA